MPDITRKIVEQVEDLSEKLVERNARIKELEAALREIDDTVSRAPSWPALVAANCREIARNALKGEKAK